MGLKLQTFAYFVYNASCAVSRYLGRFLLSVFLDAFLFDLMLSITSIKKKISLQLLAYRRCSIATRFNGLFLLRVVPGVRTFRFIGRRHDPVDSRCRPSGVSSEESFACAFLMF